MEIQVISKDISRVEDPTFSRAKTLTEKSSNEIDDSNRSAKSIDRMSQT